MTMGRIARCALSFARASNFRRFCAPCEGDHSLPHRRQAVWYFPPLARRASVPIYAPTPSPPAANAHFAKPRMSNGYLRFIGVLLIVGSIGFVTVKSAFTGGFRYLLPGFGQVFDVPAADRR